VSAAPAEVQAVRTLLGDLALYARKCLKIRTKKAQIIPFRFNRAQVIVNAKIAAQRRATGRVRVIILKARQLGMSTLIAARNFRRVQLTQNIEALIIADEKKRGHKLFQIYERFDKHLPTELKPMKRFTQKHTHLVYDNPTEGSPLPGLGSQLFVETAKDAAAGRASTIQLLHVSELAFWDHPEDVWLSLVQAVPDDDSEIIIESTANGVGDFFHAMWELAEAGENGYLPIFLPWWIHEEYTLPVTPEETEEILATEDPYEQMCMEVGFEYEGEVHKLTPEQLAWRRRKIREAFQGDERLFRQEYPATPDEAFLAAGAGFFDEDKLNAYRRVALKAKRYTLIDDKKGGVGMVPAEKGYLRVWKDPDPDGFYVIFADTATGRQVSARDYGASELTYERGGRDFSSADVYDVRSRSYVAQLHGRMAPEVFAKDLFRLGYLYTSQKEGLTIRKPALMGVERNHSSGETVLRKLKDDLKYPNLYYHRQINRRNNRVTIMLGWITNLETRMPMLDELAQVIRDETIEYPNPDGIREMFSFVRGEDGRPAAQDGAHDDRVISAAGALQMARQVRAAPLPQVPEVAVANTPTGWMEYS
jgi:hypothetical protein